MIATNGGSISNISIHSKYSRHFQRRQLGLAMQHFNSMDEVPPTPDESQSIIFAERYEELLIH